MLKTRIITALLMGAGAVAVVLCLPPFATAFVLTVAILSGAWEWSAFLRTPQPLVRVLYVGLIGALLGFAWRIGATAEGRDFVLWLAMLWWLAALAWVIFAPRRVSGWSAALAGIFALVPAWLALMHLRFEPLRGAEWVLFALVLVWAADIGAFMFGKRYGRIRLAPIVSPGKTWEGVIGGMIVSAPVAVWGSFWFDLPLISFLPLCFAVVAFSIVGDLTESLLKRYADIKDSGALIPGHGGVMDRLDSVTGAAPVLLFGLVALGVIA